MATAGEGGDAASLQDKLQVQVASSMREALDKSTSILSNLHRLSSYLDVMSSMLSAPERLKNALHQIQTIRSDSASLLQTIYLGEIGLQSLQTASMTAGILPILSDSTLSMTTPPDPPPSSDGNLFDEGSGFALGKRNGDGISIDTEPPTKKSSVAVFTCRGCQKTFGTNTDQGQMPNFCRKCRESAAASGSALFPKVSLTPILNSTPISPAKQVKRRVSKRAKLNALVCRLCGINFFYRRCMMRHLRENHAPVIDVNNLEQYMEELPTTSLPLPSSPSSQPSSLDIATCMGSELVGESNFDLSVSSSSADNSNMIIAGTQSNSEHTSSVAVATPASRFITAQSLQPVEHVILSSSQNSEQDSHDLDRLEVELNPSTTEIDLDGMKVTTTVKVSETGAAFREYKCSVCNKAFDRPYRLTRHLEIHDPNRPRLPCSYCSKSFTRKDSLESHIKSVHASVHPYTCTHETCNRSFATRSMYLNHLKVHGESKPYHCQECEESFSLLAELKEHLKKEHPENEDSRCSECFKVCLSQDDLQQHKICNHRFECEICGKVFSRLAYLQVHVKVHDGQAKLNCRFCSEGFDSLYAYRQHMKTHPEYRRVINVFPCNTCNKIFQDPDDLYSHYQSEEHKEKASSIGSSTFSTTLSITEGDLSAMNDLVTHIVMNESDDIINNIQGTQ